MIKVIAILGVHLLFIKAVTISHAIQERDDIEERIVHIRAHLDTKMSALLFAQLNPKWLRTPGRAGLGHLGRN